MNYSAGTVSKKNKFIHPTFKVMPTDTTITRRKERGFLLIPVPKERK
jgi:hypothetical protein